MNSLHPPPPKPQDRPIPGPPSESVPPQWYGRTGLERLAFEQVANALSESHLRACQSVSALCAVSAERREGNRAFHGLNRQIDRMSDLTKALGQEMDAFKAWLRTQGEPIQTLHLTPPALPIGPDLPERADALKEGIAANVERVRSTVNRVSDDEEPWDANQIRSAYP